MQSSSIQGSSDSQVRFTALGLGLVALFLGLAGFVPAFLSLPGTAAEPVYSYSGFGYLFGIFPTNYFHDAIGILVGIWGLAAFTSLSGSIVFNQIFAIVYAAQAVLGLIPFTNTLFGTMPLFGNNIWLSLLLAGVAFYFGFIKADTSVLKQSGASISNSL